MTVVEKPIRPASTLLLVREGGSGLEVMTMRRSQNMRFLPGYLAFPGGSLDVTDKTALNLCGQATLIAQERADDRLFAVAAIRECAEEVGFLCGLEVAGEPLRRNLTSEEQVQWLTQQIFWDWLGAAGGRVNLGALRFVGRWITPNDMPARFDTRFFLYRANEWMTKPMLHQAENEWAEWLRPSDVLAAIAEKREQAVAPTRAMLQALDNLQTVEACMRELYVPQAVELL